MWQYRETPPARGVISPRAMAQTVIRTCVWASNFTTLLSRWGFVIDLPGQLELAPVGQWLLVSRRADQSQPHGVSPSRAIRSGPRDKPVAGDAKAQRLVGPFARVIDPDARSGLDLEVAGKIAGLGQDELAGCEVVPVQTAVNVQSAAEPARTARGGVDVADRFEGAEENGGGVVARAGHDVQAVVHAIDQVDIGMTGRAEHDLGAPGAAAGRVGSEVVRAQIRFGLDDPPDLAAAINAANDELAQEVPSHTLGVTIVKGFWEDLHENHRTRRAMVWLPIGRCWVRLGRYWRDGFETRVFLARDRTRPRTGQRDGKG